MLVRRKILKRFFSQSLTLDPDLSRSLSSLTTTPITHDYCCYFLILLFLHRYWYPRHIGISALKWEYRYLFFCCRYYRYILSATQNRIRSKYKKCAARLFQAEEEKQQGRSMQVTKHIEEYQQYKKSDDVSKESLP